MKQYFIPIAVLLALAGPAHAHKDVWVVPSYAQRSLDKTIVYRRDGTFSIQREAPGTGTSSYHPYAVELFRRDAERHAEQDRYEK